MKSSIIKSFILIPAILMLAIVFNGCRQKGCTDKSALNYNSAADDDDGSCIYCKASKDTIGTAIVSLIDNNPSSPHYETVVATFFLTQISEQYNASQCGTSGCYVAVQVTGSSIVTNTMEFSGFMESSLFGSFDYTDIIVPSGQTVNLSNITITDCQESISNFGASFSLNTNISYF